VRALRRQIGVPGAARTVTLASVVRRRVLIVDDSEVIRRLITINLEFAGIEVRSADDGADAIEVASHWHPHLITLDVNMPGLNGFETATRLRSRPDTATTPIVLLTARTHPGDRAAADRLGIGAYVTKPFEPEVLVETILALLPDA
jgi:CheY-like chemotaxis protein